MYRREEIISDEVEWNKAEYDTIGWSDSSRIEVKQDDIKELIEKNPITKEDFETLLKKACSPKPISSPKQSKT
jgi:hypothetical protein